MRAIYFKELKSYFYTFTGWLFTAVFLALASLIFYLNNIMPRSSDIAPFYSMMSYVWMLLTPMLVMRLMAGEKRLNTDSLLRGAPLPLPALVAGKFFAACTVLLMAILISLVYPLMLSAYGRVYPAEVLTATLGFFLQGCAFIALDMMVTTNLGSTVSAAALSFGVNLFIWLTSLLSAGSGVPPLLAGMVSRVSLYQRLMPFLSAQFSLANTLFYLLFCLGMLSLSVLMAHLARTRRT